MFLVFGFEAGVVAWLTRILTLDPRAASTAGSTNQILWVVRSEEAALGSSVSLVAGRG